LPRALALDAKFIRDAVGVLSLGAAGTGAPVACAIVDQKGKTPRSEQTRIIVETGGDYLLQLPDTPPTLAALAERAHTAPPPFFANRSRPGPGENLARDGSCGQAQKADCPGLGSLVVVD
jgi:hypothetical protein